MTDRAAPARVASAEAGPGGAETGDADAALARRALALLDLTDLSDPLPEPSGGAARHAETETFSLCAAARGAPERGVPAVAAVCVWPQMVKAAKAALGDGPVRVATVANFPKGGTHTARLVPDIREMLDDGADEIDLVMPYAAFLEGDEAIAADVIGAARDAVPGVLKVILETGAFPDAASIRRAGVLAIEAGADFLKTSTGKIAKSATPEAAEALLDAIQATPVAAGRRPVGLKVSGGVRTLRDARDYLALVDRRMGGAWATPETFRFGASGLRDALVAALGAAAPGVAREDEGRDY